MSKKKGVLLKIKGTQINDLGEAQTIEIITEATFFIRDKSYYIMYHETELSGMEGTTTTLKIEPTKVTLNRMGKAELKQTYEEGVLNDGYYVTPYGIMHMSVIPSKVRVDISDAGGSIDLAYELQVGQEKISDNLLFITVEDL